MGTWGAGRSDKPAGTVPRLAFLDALRGVAVGCVLLQQRTFWVGRGFRLFPLFWLSLLGAVLLAAAGRPPVAGLMSHGTGTFTRAYPRHELLSDHVHV